MAWVRRLLGILACFQGVGMTGTLLSAVFCGRCNEDVCTGAIA